MGLETYGKEAYTERHVKVEQKKTKNQGFLDNSIMHARIGLRKHEFSPCVQARS